MDTVFAVITCQPVLLVGENVVLRFNSGEKSAPVAQERDCTGIWRDDPACASRSLGFAPGASL